MDSVAWYNGTRLHSALRYRKPRLTTFRYSAGFCLR
jgi:hypothetical protein